MNAPAQPIVAHRSIDASAHEVWTVISSPGYLEECHPFCTANPVHEWPGPDAADTIEYHNGRIVQRRFTTWLDGTGYDLEVCDDNGPLASVWWRITAENVGSALAITLIPRMLDAKPAVVRSLAYALAIRPLMRRYLGSVVRGVEWRVTTGEPVQRNQFGSHVWFSPRRQTAR
jgi:hypothetical protein